MERGSFTHFETRERFGKIIVEAASLESENHRGRNDDAFFISPDHTSAGVFDGLGGHAGGDVASNLAARTIFEKFSKNPYRVPLDEACVRMQEVFEEADHQIRFAQKHMPEYAKMMTTGAVVQLWKGGNGERRVIVGHIGDSRVYIRHPDHRLESVTLGDTQELHDFSYVGKVFDERMARAMQDKIDNAISPTMLSPVEQTIFKRKNVVSQVLGHEGGSAHVTDIAFPEGAALLLATDGLRNLTRDEIAACLNETIHDPKTAVRSLIKLAHNRSLQKGFRSSVDDITAVLIK